jgi:hypothetical protein
MGRNAVEDLAHMDRNAFRGDIPVKYRRTVRKLENRIGNVIPDLSNVDVKGGHDINIERFVAADIPMQETDTI